MERCSEFIKNKALFGGYPTQEYVDRFEKLGVRYFVDLTHTGEKKITPYTTQYNYIRYPIPDHRVPTNWRTFAQFIIKLGKITRNLKAGEKVYIHCKGGHGRSGVVVASLLCYLYKISPSDAISSTTKYHSRRKEMREKWRKMGSPQTRSQKHFVTKFFEPLYIYKNYSKYFSAGFGNDADISVNIENIGVFPTATSAFNAMEIIKADHWELIKDEVMYEILKRKFNQNETIRKNLLDTGLRPIVVRSNDDYWGKTNNTGKNMLGKLITNLRKDLYESDN